ncbi:DUF6882 domain-containing protein [Orbus mooreae]|uniref:DUF6882 domain-containing protein n=1 Tax=Orbus mooreae TaxID=3074107 RepID=UPI00370DC028
MINFFKKFFCNKEKGSHHSARVFSEPELTIKRANNEMELRTQAAINTWGLDTAAWSVDLNEGLITFINDEKGLIITAPVQVIGTYNTEDSTWLWAWDHPSINESVAEFSKKVKIFGEQYKLSQLNTRKIIVSMDEAWELTALACYLSKGEGGYSGLSGVTRVFMVYGPVTIRKNEESTGL